MLITKRSLLTGKTHEREIDVTHRQLNRWLIEGELIQNAMPHLSADDREFLISGTTPEEWDDKFGAEDEDDQPDGPNVHEDDDPTCPVCGQYPCTTDEETL